MSINYNITRRTDGSKSPLDDIASVPQVSYEEAILAFLDEHGIPLQPVTIYGGLIHQQNITFSYRTVQNKLSNLLEKGHVTRVKIDTDDGVIRDVGDESGVRAHYLITDSGSDRVAEEIV